MTAIALKQYITKKVVNIDDDNILEKIKNLINSTPEKVYELSVKQINLLNEAQNQFKNGNYIKEEAMDKKVEVWEKTK